jgi:hypothetical protein
VAARPVSTTPGDDALAAQVAALRAERDDLERRALEAEAMAEQLAEQLADAQHRLATQASGPGADTDDGHLTLFDGATSEDPRGHLAADGSDPRILPLALGATAVVAFLVFVMMLLTTGVSLLGLVVLAVAVGLGMAAYNTRYVPRTVHVVDGVVEVTHGDDTKRFDLRNDSIRLDVQGIPGDAFWRVRFHRRALDPVDVDDTMVDPAEFMARLREYRPGL